MDCAGAAQNKLFRISILDTYESILAYYNVNHFSTNFYNWIQQPTLRNTETLSRERASLNIMSVFRYSKSRRRTEPYKKVRDGWISIVCGHKRPL